MCTFLQAISMKTIHFHILFCSFLSTFICSFGKHGWKTAPQNSDKRKFQSTALSCCFGKCETNKFGFKCKRESNFCPIHRLKWSRCAFGLMISSIFSTMSSAETKLPPPLSSCIINCKKCCYV